MSSLRTRVRHALLLLAWVGLAACGGGGGTAADTAPVAGGPAVDVSPVAAADPGSRLPAGWQQGAFMQIFVRSYKDSDGDGVGDLRGLIGQLDYLRDLGVSGLWLMPVMPSQDRDHGYAVSDYRSIEAQYGSLSDLDELLRQAHARGIGVILDYVINHSAAEHPLFANARLAGGNPYRDWYVWQGIKPSGWSIYGSDPWRGGTGNHYFAPFWDQMPDFNLLNPKVAAWHHDNLRFWLNRGVDGFRFDAVGHLVENGASAWENQPQNYTLLRDARQVVNGYAQRFLVCEGPSDPRGYSAACGSAFAFGHQSNILNAARGDAAAVQEVASFHNTAPAGISTMLSNHDSFAGQRVHDQLGGNLARYRLAAAIYLLQPGTPFIYYGEEIGLAGGGASLSGDPKLRTPMSWTGSTATAGFTTGTPYRSLSANVATANVAAQLNDPASLLSFYKTLLALRKSQPALASGSYDAAAVSGSVMSFERRLGGERVLVVINYGSSVATVALGNLPAAAALSDAYPGGGADLVADANGQASLDIGALTLRVFSVR
jgi:alpha-amylase